MHRFQINSRKAKAGDKDAGEKLSELRPKVTNQKLKVDELEGQLKLLEIQVTVNKSKRKNAAANTKGTEEKAIIAGVDCVTICVKYFLVLMNFIIFYYYCHHQYINAAIKYYYFFA